MNLQAAIKIHHQDKWSWLYIPLLIIATSFLFGLSLSLVLPAENVLVPGFTYIFLYMAIIGLISFNQTFSYALGMSVRRIDYFVGLSLKGITTSLLWAIVFVVFALLEQWTNNWGNVFTFFHFPYLNDGNIGEQFGVYFLILNNFFFASLFVAIFTKRFGLKGIIIFGLLFFFSLTAVVLLISVFHKWFAIFEWFAQYTAFQLTLWFVPVILFLMLLSYFMIRKTTV